MLTKLQLVVLGVVVFHGVHSNASQKPESPQVASSEQVAALKELQARLDAVKQQEQVSNNKTNPMPIPSAKFMNPILIHRYPGKYSPTESWIPYYNDETDSSWVSDCP